MHANLHRVFDERDDAARRSAIDATYSVDVSFTDPEGTVVGVEALDAKARALLERFPGFHFSEAGPMRESGSLGYAPWNFGPADGDPVVRGVDIALIRDSRITELHTFVF
ncbi:nuclear transport factor 2 family protein [Planctomonas sp. JC2975]|nr:nuclear transport factor 2 family protein [Planctomonas sp. JC2975]NNC13642.1 nuclear transport factor 2 family protein [Planctomonas sp. JC2975]